MLIVHVLLKIHLSLACISFVSNSLKTMKLFFLCLPASVYLPDVEIKKKKKKSISAATRLQMCECIRKATPPNVYLYVRTVDA